VMRRTLSNVPLPAHLLMPIIAPRVLADTLVGSTAPRLRPRSNCVGIQRCPSPALYLESIKARSGVEDCLFSSLKDIAKVQNSNPQPTGPADMAYRACPKILGSWRASSKSSRSDLARRPMPGTDVSMIRCNLSTNRSTVMPNLG
jgi:hypothetical protein